jgi:murein DD-endopeptidase MepM/ murein hydrolase activator NlpD
MNPINPTISNLGTLPPISGDGRQTPPDRREISVRWLTGTFLTGLTSIILMGTALSAALDGRKLLTTPAELIIENDLLNNAGDVSGKINRLNSTTLALKISDKRLINVSTVTKVGDSNVVRTLPFGYVDMALAAGNSTNKSYPAFNSINMFANNDSDKGGGIEAAQIYGAKVESDVSLKTSTLDVKKMKFNSAYSLSLEEVEEAVRISGASLSDGDTQTASLHYLDPLRFGFSDANFELNAPSNVKIVQENVTVSPRPSQTLNKPEFIEEIIPIRSDTSPQSLLKTAGFKDKDTQGMSEAIITLLHAPILKSGWALRVGYESIEERRHIVRASVYEGQTHLFTIAIDDHEQYVPTEMPENTDDIIAALSNSPRPIRVRGELPSVYDGLYRAAYNYDLTPRMVKQLVKMLASEVDFKARLSPSDSLRVFYSIQEGLTQASDESDILYVQARFNGSMNNYYRYRDKDGSVDYYNKNGDSTQQFLIRKPVPNGELRSGFGMRRHPILGYVRLHAGTDWSAPRGTPIIAAGTGIVEKSGWASGYGNQTIIKHANGYVSSYSHQNSIATGISPGTKVRQGQIIGTVGSTGLSTGPHLHYELMINGAKVDPMRVRLPSGKSLSGEELILFKKERERIDTLISKEVAPDSLASN